MGVRFFFDVNELPLVVQGVPEERALLNEARNGSEIAAAELLLKYENGTIKDPVVRNCIALGHTLVAKQLATAALRKKSKGRSETKTALNYFGNVSETGKRGKKPEADRRLQLLSAAGKRLTAEDVESALAQRSDVPNPLQIHRLEKMLAAYVRRSFCAGASEAVAIEFVQHSFPELPWEIRDAPIHHGAV